jgi:N6-adenosine-specific RNA methylase IME4
MEAASRALAEARTLEEVKDIRDQAQAIQYYLRQQGYCFDAQQDAAELKVRAERKLGKLLEKTVEHEGGRPKKHSRNGRVSGTLPEGVNYNQSSRWQKAGTVKDDAFEEHLKDLRAKRAEITTAGVLRLARDLKREETDPKAHGPEACTVDDLHKLVSRGERFGTIYADPPWQYGNQGTRAATDRHYQTMTVEEIRALPVGELAADDSHLHLWTTNAFLFECPKIFDAWGFEYKGVLVWVKPQMGIGNYWRVSHEFLLLATRGNAPFTCKNQKSWIHAARTRHSAKPAAFRKAIEKASPGPRLELFGRKVVDGWTVWGNEIERTHFGKDVREL